MYTFVDAAVVRAATETSSLDVPPWPDLTGSTDEDVAQWCLWLQHVWASDGFAAAVELASPVLARRVREVCEGRRHPQRQVRGAVLSVIRYLLRMTSRATPFGLFAGVSLARIGSPLAAQCGKTHHAVARIDTEWLADVITRLEMYPELRHRLLVMGNNLAFVRDGRLVVGCQQQPGASTGTRPAEVSVRHTRAVRTIMRDAQAPVRLGDLVGTLAADFPRTSESVIEGMLAGLVAQRILVTSLHPPMTATDPLAYVIEGLVAAGAEAVPGVAELLSGLREIHADLARHNHAASPAQGRDLRASAARKMMSLSRAERPVTVDLRLDCGVALPLAVAREAEAIAAALVRLAQHPSGFPAWRDYHRRFLERYGIGALVRVAEIVNPDTGLGFPAGYRDSHLKPPPTSGLTERDVALLALAQNAAMEQNTEIVLDEEMIAGLAVGDDATGRVQPHTELSFRVQATTLDALNQGEFELAVTGVSRAAGVTTGRFLDLLDAHDRERVFAAYAALPTVSENALPVQVSCPPLSLRTENVSRSPTVLPHLLPLAEHHPHGDAVIPLEDLAVSGDAQQLYLVSVSRRRPVEPLVFSAVELTNHTHPLVRFLSEISTAHSGACTPFSWGAASRLPFLPRVRYRRTILSPARWTLAATNLPGPTAPWQDWADSVATWRRRFRVPDAVYLGEGDRRIRLNLDEPAHLHLVRADLDRAGQATLREAPQQDTLGWIDGRIHEIVLPLAATGRPVAQRAWSDSTIGREHGHLPASSDWLYVKLHGHPDRQTAILTTHLHNLLSTWDNPPEWWFLRYHDPEPHLRLRILLRSANEFSQTAHRVSAWTSELRRLGLVGQVQIDTYYPETGRFGEGAAMTAAESVFAADSAAAIAQLTLTGRRGAPYLHAVIAASLVDLTISVTGGIADGMRWLIDHVSTPSTPAPARDLHDHTIRLANPHDDWAALRGIPGGNDIAATWARRRAALAAYRDTLIASGTNTPNSVLPDLLHLHHVRMTGISPDTERACGRLARAAALSWTTRTQGAI